MLDKVPPIIDGDRAIECSGQDKLGFRDLAVQVANAVVARSTSEGLVVSIEGEWGSGKSSLLNLISSELERLPEENKPTTINFQPWLIGNRDALIAKLFDEVFKGLQLVASRRGDHKSANTEKAKKAIKALEKFVGVLSSTGSLFEVAGDASAIAPIKWFGKMLKALGKWVGRSKTEPKLSDLKSKLDKALRELDHRFVIIIDDLDRLEPREATEVLRLVRSVIDLPNIIYLLSYDGKILSHNIQQASGVEDGQAYLEKIVQLTIPVPQPEAFALRQWFADELQPFAPMTYEDGRDRLKEVIDREGMKQLRTPRAVVRCLDAIRFVWPALEVHRLDISDIVWLQMVKVGNLSMYRWIEEYCLSAVGLNIGTARISRTSTQEQLTRLLEVGGSSCFSDFTYRLFFADQLPGIEAEYADDGDEFRLFEHDSDETRDANIRERRLASPDHSRLYFSLNTPSHVLDGEDYRSFWEVTSEGPIEAGKAFRVFNATSALGSLSQADILLERLIGETRGPLDSQQSSNFLLALSNVLDDAIKQDQYGRFGLITIFDRATRLVPILLKALDEKLRSKTINTMFSKGTSISWLTHLFRKETFAHGRYGDRVSHSSEWLFTDDELNIIGEVMLERYRNLSKAEYLQAKEPANLLFAWQQGGDDKGPSDFVKKCIATDEGLIEILESFTSTVSSSSSGVYLVLRRDNLSSFLNFDEAQARLVNLMNHPSLGGRVKAIKEHIEAATNW
ncbi:MAG: KAP family NTPase [Cohaesibacter sp.]|nr:KAP family NTPase [Cohaesibacter sp.]